MTELTENKKYELCMTAIEAKTDIEWKFIELGTLLYKIKAEKLWEPSWESWHAYLDEMKLEDSKASRLINIYQVFVLHYQVEPKQLAEAGGWTVVAELLPVIDSKTTSREEVDRLLGIVTIQTRKDARQTLQAVKTGIECEHENTRRLVLDICEDCGHREAVHGEIAPAQN